MRRSTSNGSRRAASRSTNPKAPFAQQQWGGVFGGPIRRNRTFYFGSFERLDVDREQLRDDRRAARWTSLRAAGFAVETGHVPYDVTSIRASSRSITTSTAAASDASDTTSPTGTNENAEPWGGLVARSRGGVLDNRDHMFAGSHTSLLSASLVNEIRFQVARRDQGVLALDPTCTGACDADERRRTDRRSLRRRQPRPSANHAADSQQHQISGARYGELSARPASAEDRLRRQPRRSLRPPCRFISAAATCLRRCRRSPGAARASQRHSGGLPRSSGAYMFRDTAIPARSYRLRRLDVPAGPVACRGRPDRAGRRANQRQFWQSRAYQVPSLGDYDIPADRNNIAPRLGFNWDPTGTGALSIHSAYGVYHDSIIGAAVGVPDIVNGSTGVRTLVMRFP